MPPNGRSWQELTWSWACSTGSPASDQVLDAAANAAWPYAVLCAWTYLKDDDGAHDLMDHAAQNASDYIARHPDASLRKLTARIKSVLRRKAKQLGAWRKHEISYGSAVDLEAIYAARPEIEQWVYASELYAHLSPFAKIVAHRRWLEYSWRKIGRKLKMDYSAVRDAYFRELESLQQDLSRPGDSQKCD